jgi:NAD(P)-dependent dehydrogenase (short-subunit alcohol dehydrogenase family)
MKDKIILITGATSGIGKAAAMALAKQGAHVIIHGRSEEKAKATQQEIITACREAGIKTGNGTRNEAGNEHPHVDILVADLFLLSEVRKMADTFNARYDHLDVLINNAGMMMNTNRETTSEGNEKTIAVNLLAPFLLTQLLMGKLTTNARIINVASSAHKESAKPDFNDMQLEKNYSPLRAYGNAKLFLILYTRQLAKKLNGITVNSLHPGAVASNFSAESNLGPVLNFLGKIARRFFKTAEQGADTIIYLATSPDVKNISGKYYVNRHPAEVAKKYNTPQNEALVWVFCEQQTATW